MADKITTDEELPLLMLGLPSELILSSSVSKSTTVVLLEHQQFFFIPIRKPMSNICLSSYTEIVSFKKF
jgi:hypothetical protein